MTNPTNIRGTYGRTQTHGRGALPPTPQGILREKNNTHALHSQNVVVEYYVWTGNYAIRSGVIEKVLVTTNNLTTLG